MDEYQHLRESADAAAAERGERLFSMMDEHTAEHPIVTEGREAAAHHTIRSTQSRAAAQATRAHGNRSAQCWCLDLLTDHRAGDDGCAFNADWTSR